MFVYVTMSTRMKFKVHESIYFFFFFIPSFQDGKEESLFYIFGAFMHLCACSQTTYVGIYSGKDKQVSIICVLLTLQGVIFSGVESLREVK